MTSAKVAFAVGRTSGPTKYTSPVPYRCIFKQLHFLRRHQRLGSLRSYEAVADNAIAASIDQGGVHSEIL